MQGRDHEKNDAKEPTHKRSKKDIKESFDFEKMPPEIRHHVFNFLTIKEFPNTALVSKDFYRLSHSSQLWLPALKKHFPDKTKDVRSDYSLNWHKAFSNPRYSPDRMSLSDLFQHIESTSYPAKTPEITIRYFRWARENDTQPLLASFAHEYANNPDHAHTELAERIIHVDDSYNTLWSIAARFNNQDLLNAYFNIILPFFAHDEIDNMIDPTRTGPHGCTILHYAIMCRQPLDYIRGLIEQGCDIRARDRCHQTPSMYAASHHFADGIRLLLSMGINVNEPNDIDGETALHLAATSGAIDCINLLLDNGAQINGDTDVEIYPPLFYAVYFGEIEVIKLLVERGAKATMAAHDGVTALMIAAESGHNDIVEFLLHQNADINQCDTTDHMTALLLAITAGKDEAAALLLCRGANINHVGGTLNSSAIDYAIFYGRTRIIRLLLEFGASIHKADGQCAPNPLHVAASKANDEIVRFFLDKGIHPDCRQENLVTPLMLAAGTNQTANMQVLLNAGANVNATTEAGLTPLHYAVTAKGTDALRLLLENGADITTAFVTTKEELDELQATAYQSFRMFSILRKIPGEEVLLTPALFASMIGNDEAVEILRQYRKQNQAYINS